MEKNTNISLLLKKGRGRWEIIMDILTAIRDEKKMKKTRIMQKAYLDWRTFNRYFEYLVNDGFLADINDNESFVLTSKGWELLERLKDVAKVLDHS